MTRFSVNTKAYPNTGAQWLKEACGILPHWLIEFDAMHHMGMVKFEQLKDHMANCYGFGELFEFKGTVDPDTQEYISQYEDDEPLAPYMTVHMKDGRKAHIYPYAMLALPTPDGYFITRMD